MKGMALEFVGKWVLILVVVFVGVSLIYVLFKPVADQDIQNQISQMVEGSQIPICRAYDNLEVIDELDFRAISFARATGKCNSTENNVTLGFVLSKEFMEKFLTDFNFISGRDPLVFYRDNCASFTGYKGFIVESPDQKVLFNKDAKIKIINLDPGVGICYWK